MVILRSNPVSGIYFKSDHCCLTLKCNPEKLKMITLDWPKITFDGPVTILTNTKSELSPIRSTILLVQTKLALEWSHRTGIVAYLFVTRTWD